jgi:Co/Zn/Cd efflux system component
MTLRQTVLVVAALNLAWFGVEFAAALRIESVSLLADSIDFLEDASVNLLIALALGWTVAARARIGFLLAALMVVPAGAVVWTLWEKLQAPTIPEPFTLSLVGFGALVINLGCALLLARFRAAKGSLTQAAFLSARNDALANLAIILAGIATLTFPSIWPDLLVGLAIVYMNLDAAREVWIAARSERDTEAQA